ncbi:MAG TPA: APC family permease [Bellilinea sp.]|nr:APC family permease [Bellilinea sp.]
MLNKLRYFFIGQPIPSQAAEGKKLNNFRALAAFSPDALSSMAYANQEIFLGLVVAGAAGLRLQLPIAVAIALLLGIVALSYAQTIKGYPNGGGSYVVAKENLGKYPGIFAGAALILDYILTAAVSLTAGVAAIGSTFPELLPYRVWIALGLLALITLLNLRGLQESGTVMAIPVYSFVASFMIMIGVGIYKAVTHGPTASLATAAPSAIEPLGLILILHAFSAGCTALTGIEAISNGVTAFKPPAWRNAQKTLLVMAVLMTLLFVGSIALTQYFAVVPKENETILSALGRTLLGNSFFYYLVQFSTLAILAVAANTSFAGFPRITAILSEDKFMPRQLTNLGERLVYNNGILLLVGFTAFLIVVFRGDSHALVPLFAVGAFSAFTLSQIGMVKHWMKIKDPGWRWKAVINGVGALVTGISLIVIAVSKFTSGAWLSLIIIPAFMYGFMRINKHYAEVSKELSMKGLPPSLLPLPPQRVVIPVSGVHRGMIDAVNFARSISRNITAVYVDMELGPDEIEMQKRWNDWFPDIPLQIIPSPYRTLIEPLLSYLDRTDAEHNDGQKAILMLAELIPAKSWEEMLHNKSAIEIKQAILYMRRQSGENRIIIEVPFHLKA